MASTTTTTTTTSTATDSGGAASEERCRRRPRILLGVTGSVAAVRAPELACRLVEDLGADVRIVLSHGGLHFWQRARDYHAGHWRRLQELLLLREDSDDSSNNNNDGEPAQQQQPPRVRVIRADDEWRAWERLGDPVLHIELRDWADVLLVAPLSAHSLAKLAHGLCDDALGCVARAWDFGHYEHERGSSGSSVEEETSPAAAAGRSQEGGGGARRSSRGGKPVLLAPAMNTAMWEHPLTERQLRTVQSFAGGSRRRHQSNSNSNSNSNSQQNDNKQESTSLVRIVPPQSKVLACGEVGVGAMASVDAILQSVRSAIDGIADL